MLRVTKFCSQVQPVHQTIVIVGDKPDKFLFEQNIQKTPVAFLDVFCIDLKT